VRADARVCLFMHSGKLPMPTEFAAAVVSGAGMRRVLLLLNSGCQGWMQPQGSTECRQRMFLGGMLDMQACVLGINSV